MAHAELLPGTLDALILRAVSLGKLPATACCAALLVQAIAPFARRRSVPAV